VWGEPSQQVPAASGEALEGVLVVGAPGPVELCGQLQMTAGAQAGGVLSVGEMAGLQDEALESLGQPRSGQLIAEDGR
jgi:hypothetical protein